jgi:FkbM family methyltransferase
MSQTRLPPTLQLKSMLTGSALEGLAMRLRWALTAPQRIRHPELWDTYLEEDRLELILKKVLPANATGIDVGGHLGSFLVLLNKVAPQGKHAVFEASAGKGDWLRRKFPKVAVHGFAVSDQAGTALFRDNQEKPGYSALEQSQTTASSEAYQVKTIRLDDILPGMERVDIIKLDIEGHELPALRGAMATIEKRQPILIFECGSQYAFDDLKQDRNAIFDFVTGTLGYTVFTYVDFLHDKGPLSRDEFRKCGLYPFRAFNFIALPATKAAAG